MPSQSDTTVLPTFAITFGFWATAAEKPPFADPTRSTR